VTILPIGCKTILRQLRTNTGRFEILVRSPSLSLNPMASLPTLAIDALFIWGTCSEARDNLDQQLRQLLKDIRAREQAPVEEPAEPDTNYRETRAFHAIEERFGYNPTLPVLVAMAESIAKHVPVTVKLDRRIKRRKSLIYGWFETQIELVLPLLSNFHLFTRDGARIAPPNE
jgi:hypothetical protein